MFEVSTRPIANRTQSLLNERCRFLSDPYYTLSHETAAPAAFIAKRMRARDMQLLKEQLEREERGGGAGDQSGAL